MKGRRAIVGLALLCALVFSAFAASSASALGTTAFTCAPVSEGRQFSDEHCITAAGGGGSGFRHTEIAQGLETEVEGTNAKTASATTTATPAVLHGTTAGIAITITCKKVSSTGKLTNTGLAMKASGPSTIEYSECVTIINGTEKCKVVEPITAIANISTVISGAEMYVKIEGAGAGGAFVILDFVDGPKPPCPEVIKNPTFPITGNAIGTPNGATLEFKEKEPNNTLSFGGQVAEYTGIETIRRKGGNPITLTTTAS